MKNCNMFPHLSFILKISIFSKASLEPNQTSIMELFCENSYLLFIVTIFHIKSSIILKIIYKFLLTDQISLLGWLSFLRYWAICALQLFVSQVVTS